MPTTPEAMDYCAPFLDTVSWSATYYEEDNAYEVFARGYPNGDYV